MADNEEQLAIDIIAKLNNLEKQMSKASGITARAYREMTLNSRKATKQMENDAIRSAVRINQAIASIGTKAGNFSKSFAVGAMSAVSLQASQQLIDTSTRIKNALKVAGLEGADLTRVYDQLFASAQKNAAPLEALVTLYGRASLVQKELNVSTKEMLQFTDNVAVALRVSGQSAQESSGALLQLSQALGSGIVRAEEFNSILEGALPIAQAAASGLKEAGGSVAKLRQLVVDGKVSSEAFFRAFEAGADMLQDKVANAEMTTSQGFVRLQNVLIDTAGKINDVTGASDSVGRALNIVSDIIEGLGGVVRSFADNDLSHLASQIYTVLNPLSELIDKIGGIKNLPAFFSTVQRSMFNAVQGKPIAPPERNQSVSEILRERLGSAGKQGRVTAGDQSKTALNMSPEQIGERIAIAFADKSKQVSLADYKPPSTAKGDKKKAGSKSHSKTTDQKIDDDIQSIIDRTAALQAEIQMVGLSYQEQEKRRVAIDLEQAALAKLRDEAIKKGQADLSNIQISEEQRSKIEAISEAYAQQADQLRIVREQQDRVEQANDEFYASFKSGFTDAITGAKSLSDALSDILKKLGEMLLSTAFDALFKPASGGSGGGAFGSIFSGIGSLITGKYASGTNFATGGLSLVGEKGPELVNLPRGSQVIPNHKLGQGAGGSEQNITVPVIVHIDATGADPAGLERVKNEVSRLKQEIPALVIENVRRISRQNIRI